MLGKGGAPTEPTNVARPDVTATKPTNVARPDVAATDPDLAVRPDVAANDPALAVRPDVAATDPALAARPDVAANDPALAARPDVAANKRIPSRNTAEGLKKPGRISPIAAESRIRNRHAPVEGKDSAPVAQATRGLFHP